ncbi:hypothetical protein BJ972_003224 [Agromyces atrinae]|uniref:Uncharacterized protein n=1 Tax=Agromyces atrinae TaxID=592376 RepID=A0A852SJE2_9MICO|nr:hypothetical protein [Agromyces atrinae]
MKFSEVVAKFLLEIHQHIDRAAGLNDRHLGITFLAGHGGKLDTPFIIEGATDILS